MTNPNSKAGLRERLIEELELTSRLDSKLAKAESVLRNLGYERVTDERPIPGSSGIVLFDLGRTDWRLSREALEEKRKVSEDAKAAHQKDIAAAVEQSRLDTLAAVIDALELSEYGYQRPNSTGFAYPAADIRGALGLGPKGPERLWSDIQTALALRAEAKTDADRRAAAERLKRATRPAFATGGYTGTTGDPAGLVQHALLKVGYAGPLSAADTESIRALAKRFSTSTTAKPSPAPAAAPKKPKAKKKAAKK
jgi:hypothetical protein